MVGLHFIKKRSGEETERKLFKNVSKVINSFS